MDYYKSERSNLLDIISCNLIDFIDLKKDYYDFESEKVYFFDYGKKFAAIKFYKIKPET